VLDAHLAQTASSISAQRDSDEREDEDEVDTDHAPVLHRYGRRVMFQVWRNGTTLGLHSQHAPDTPLSTVRDGFSDARIVGSQWRVFSTWDARSRVLVQVAEQNYERDELATAVADARQPASGVEVRRQSDAARCGRCAVRNRSTGDEPQSALRAGARVDRTGAPQAPGSGLGLSIVQRILELHRGGMHLDAPSTGSGCQVTVALPRVRDERV
jgi:hypothetical protein